MGPAWVHRSVRKEASCDLGQNGFKIPRCRGPQQIPQKRKSIRFEGWEVPQDIAWQGKKSVFSPAPENIIRMLFPFSPVLRKKCLAQSLFFNQSPGISHGICLARSLETFFKSLFYRSPRYFEPSPQRYFSQKPSPQRYLSQEKKTRIHSQRCLERVHGF